MAPTTFDRTALLEAHLTARRWAHAHPDLAGYHQARYAALAAAFGVDLAATKGSGPLGGLFERVVSSIERCVSPFADYLEAPRSFGVLAQRRSPAITSGLRTARAGLTALALDVIEQHWGLGAAATVTADDLHQRGFDPTAPAPDPDDFW